MKPLPDNLTEDELLVLHLAGELPEPMRTQFASRLARNSSAHRSYTAAFESLDARLRTDAHTSVRPAVGPAVQQLVGVIRSTESLPIAAVRRRNWLPPVWTIYPAAAAAVVAIFMGGWWFKVRDEFSPKATVAALPSGFTTVLRGEPDRDLSDLTDDQIVTQFDPMVFEPRVGLEQPLSELQYLESITQ
jgi:hypothetical protein